MYSLFFNIVPILVISGCLNSTFAICDAEEDDDDYYYYYKLRCVSFCH